MNIEEARASLPELAGLDDDQVVDALHQAYYPDLPRERVAQALGVKPAEPPTPPRTFLGTVADTGISALKGAIGVPEAVVGMADIATGGRAGKALEEIGFRPGDAKKMLDEQLSPAQKAANEKVQKAQGVWDTFKAAVTNPSTVAQSVVESLPVMGLGGLAGRGMMLATGGRIGAGVAGALGEGVAAAGSSAEQIRQETTDRLLTGEQSGLAASVGAATAGFGMLGAKIAKKLGIADVDTMLAGAAVNPRVAKGITRQVLEGAVSEGLLEELPQSVVEQVLQNIALDKPLDEGVPQAAVLGTLAGAAMGGGANLASSLRRPKEPEKTPADIMAAPTVDAAVDAFTKSVKMPSVPGGTDVGAAGEAGKFLEQSLTGTDRAALLGAPSMIGDPNASMLTAARAGQEDRRQEALGDDAVARMREEANNEAQLLREYDRRPLPELDAIIQAGDRTGPAGVPLSEAAANKTASAIGGITIPVNGGWIVRPRTKPGDENATKPSASGDNPSAAPAAPTAAAAQPAPAAAPAAPGGVPAGTGVAPRGGPDRLDAAPTGIAAEGDRGARPGDGSAADGQGALPGQGGDASLDGRGGANGDAAQQPVDGWVKFPPEMRSLEVPRADMPQVKAEHRGALVNYLNARGIEHSEEMDVDPGTLRPTQAEYSPAKVEQARAFTGGNRAILVSADNRIVDGHHQWAQALQDGKPIRIIRLKAPVTQLLKAVHEFPSSTIDEASAAPAQADQGAAPAGETVRDDAGETGAGRQNDVQPAGASTPNVGARWDRMTPGERRVLLTQNTKAKGKAIDRVSAQPWDALEPGWQKTVMRIMPAAAVQDEQQAMKAPPVSLPSSAESLSVNQTVYAKDTGAAGVVRGFKEDGKVVMVMWDGMADRRGAAYPRDQLTTKKPDVGQRDELDSEMQGYEDRAGIEGWWGVGGARGQKDSLLAPGRVQALQAIGVSNQRAGYGKDGDLTKVLWNYLPTDIQEKLVALRKGGWTPKEDAAAPAPTAAPAPAARPQPGDTSYTLLDARNDLIEMRTIEQGFGVATDDRLLERIRRQEKLVKELEDLERRQAAGDDQDKAIIQPAVNAVATEAKENAAPALKPKNAQDMSRAEGIAHLEAGGKLVHLAGTEFEETVWIEESRAQKTWVVKSKEKGGSATFTTGPAGPDRQWGWGRGDAAQRAAAKVTFKEQTMAATAPSPVGAPKPPKAALAPASEQLGVGQTVYAKDTGAAGVVRGFKEDGAVVMVMWDGMADRRGSAYPRDQITTTKPETAPAPTAAPAPARPTPSTNTVFTEDAAAAARARLKAKLNRPMSGIDPEMMVDGITLAGYHLEKGARTFAAFAKAMVADLGEQVKPYLKSWYSALRYDPRAQPFVTGMSSAAMVDEFNLDDVAAPSDTQPAAPANNGGQDGTATRNLDRPGTGTPGGEPSPDVRAPEEGGAAGGVPAAGGQRRQPRPGNADGAGADVPGGVGAGAGAPVSAPRGGRGARDAGDGRVPRPPRADAGPGLFDDARREGADDGLTSPNEPATPAPQFKLEDFTIEDDFALGEGGQKTKFRNNVEAIRLAKELMEGENSLGGGRVVTPDEQKILAKYVGWGGLAQAFDAANADWQREFAELKSLLTDEEYAAAKRSTRYAHYTSRPVIQDGIYAALRRFGFTGGRVLEPGAGVGNFIGLMPQDMRSAGRVTAIEREPIAATIARALYPLQNVQQADFTEFKGNDGYFDAVVGNPPFAADAQTDASGRKHLSGLSLHNYFFAKSVDMLREGGILAQVVTNSFLDAQGDRARKYIGDRTKFLGAIRLPNNAFSKNAGTEVTTDIIFLQKRPESEWGGRAARAEAAAWMTSPEWESSSGTKVALNKYFQDHPEMMLGDFGPFGTMYRKGSTALVARPGQDTAALLKEAVQRLPEGIYKSAAETGTEDIIAAAVIALNKPPVQEGGFFMDGGKLVQRLPDLAGEARGVEITADTQWTAKTRLGEDGFDKLRRLSEMRGTLRALLAAELSNDGSMEDLRKKLNEQYDSFVKEHHLIGDKATYRVFDDDPDFPLLLSLETNYTPGIGKAEAKKLGVPATKSKADKSPIFRQRVVDSRKTVQKVETPEDALAVSMAERGRLDTAYIAELLGKPADDVLRDMTSGDRPLLFLDPASDEYVLRDAYLSGNVRQKLAQAKEAGMSGNVEALEKVQPEDVPAHEIGAKIGAPWVPTSVYEDFAKELLGEGTKASIHYQKLNSSYSAYIQAGSEVNNSNKWGIPKYPAHELLAALLNNRTIKVEYRDKEGVHLDQQATDDANTKAQEIKDRFNDWLFSDPDRSELLVRAYNDTNNNYVTRTYDGSWMTFPGKVPDGIIKFRRHQRNAIARIVQERTTLLDHVVGAGKTFTVVAAAMELRRTGLAKKPLVAVPNHLVKQWAADFYRLYPGANILTATKKDFERVNRRRFLAKIATGDWDAVVIAHSSYGFIRPGAEFEAKFNAKQVELIQAAVQDVQDSDANEQQKKRTVKQLEGMIERLENRIKALRDKAMDDLLDFDQLGVDQLFVDEAHLFKNLLYTTKLQGVAGLGDPAGAKRAYDMYVKTQEVMEKNGRGQGVVFATGTPVSNSLAEKYHMMRYLMPRQMEELGFQSFDAWANTYAEVTQTWMQKISGDGFKVQNRMGTFVNVHELLRLFDQVADTVTNDDIKKAFREENGGKEYPLPPVKTGRRIPVSIDQTQAQKDFMAQLVQRAQVLERRKGPPKKGEDNILSLMTDARKAAMDIRLVDMDRTEREVGGRVDKAAENIVERYKKYDSHKGTQLVFSDLGTPKKYAQDELKEYHALQGIIAEATDEVRDRAALGDERSQDIVDAAEDAERELDEKGADWLTSVKAALRGFSVYDDLRQALVDRGIPEHEIAFIHDYNTDERKAALFRKVNAGEIRVLIGSTAKMGAGTNVQQRLVAMHHMDVPWRPSDVEQREGRIIRQGNVLFENERDPSTVIPGFEVEILAYVTKDTLDMRMWQIQEAKLKVINQLRTRQIERNMDNAFEDAEMSATEMQAAATGNMDLLYEIQARNDIKKLEQKRRSFDAQKNDLIARKRRNARDLEQLPALIADATAKRELANQYRALIAEQQAKFKVEIDGKEFTDRKAAGDYLQSLYDAKIYTRTVNKIREELAPEKYQELQDEVMAMRNLPDDNPKKASAVFELTSWQEKAAPLDATLNGESFTARAKMVEAWRNIAGDTDGFLWSYKGEQHNRRATAALAAKEAVSDSILDQKVVRLGEFGPFRLEIEGQPASGRREEKSISLDVVLLSGDEKIAEHVFDIPLAEAGDTLKYAERVLDWGQARSLAAGSDVSWLESNLRSAQAAAKDLAKAEDLGQWPDEDKLAAAREKHKQILARLNSGSGGKASGRVMEHALSGEKVVVLRGPYMQDDVNLVMVRMPDGTQQEIPWAVLVKDGKPDDATGPTFDQGEPGTGRKVGELQQLMDTITSEWTKAPPVTVVRGIASPAVPAAVREEGARRVANGGRAPRGVIYDGQVWLFADAIGSSRQAAEVVFHEVLGHYGMRGHFGRAFDAHLDRVALLRRPDVDAMLTRTGMKDTPENRRRAAEEVLAYMAQTKPELGLVQRAIAIIRDWLRENLPTIFGDISLTDDELVQKFILPARRYVEGPGGPGGGMEAAPAFAAQSQPFYSALARGVEGVPAKAQPVAGWKGAIQALVNKGTVKADEVEWSGVLEWMDLQQGKVSKDAVLAYLDQNGVKVQEVTLAEPYKTGELDSLLEQWAARHTGPTADAILAGEPWNATRAIAVRKGDAEVVKMIDRYDTPTKYSQYTLPGGENYREVLLTLPEKTSADPARAEYEAWASRNGLRPNATFSEERYKRETGRDAPAPRTMTAMAGDAAQNYKSSHWDAPNVLAHIRLNDRTSEATAYRVENKRSLNAGRVFDTRAEAEADMARYPESIRPNLHVIETSVPKRVLFVEELQSDWAQEARRKGFNTAATPEQVAMEVYGRPLAQLNATEREGVDMEVEARNEGTGGAAPTTSGKVPRAPFIDSTDKWLTLALKRIMVMAAQEGYDRVAFVNGEQSAERYDLSKQVNYIHWNPGFSSDPNVMRSLVEMETKDGKTIGFEVDTPPGGVGVIAEGDFAGKRLEDVVGKEVAQKINERDSGDLRGLDLKVGGEGMVAFYDKIVPTAVNKLLSKVGGGKVDATVIPQGAKFKGYTSYEVGPNNFGTGKALYGIKANGERVIVDQNGDVDAKLAKMREEMAGLAQPGFTLTPAMREKLDAGMPMFNQGDAATLNSPRQFKDTARMVLREIHDSPGKVHWWHKSVGTQYNLAQRSMPFRRVFERVQDFLNDVSLYATEAANEAPTILPKLETWRDMLKQAMPVKDAKALSRPVFEGTLLWTRDAGGNAVKVEDLEQRASRLTAEQKADEMVRRGFLQLAVLRMWEGHDHYEAMVNTRYEATALKPGIVFTDGELTRIFGMDEKQRGLYREFRKATDESIRALTLSDMVRHAGRDGDAVRSDVMTATSVEAGATILADHLRQLAEAQPDRAAALNAEADRAMDRALKAIQLMDKGYAPLSRFGHYTVTVRKDGEVAYFGMYESRMEAARAAQAMAADPGFEDAQITRGTLNEDDYKLYAGVSPETVELFGELLGLDPTGDADADQAFQAYIKLAKSNRSAMKRMLHRKGTAGFSEDAARVLANFIYSNSRQVSKNLHLGEVDRMIEDMRNTNKEDGEIRRQATRLREYINNPAEEAHQLRGLLFAQYLGGSVAAGLVNMMQPFQVTLPWLSQFGGIKAAGGQMKDALKVAWAKSTGDARLDAALKRATEEGLVAPQEVHMLMAQAQGSGGLRAGDGTKVGNAWAMTGNALTRLGAAWGKPFATAELFNRRVTFVAAYRTAVAQKMADPYGFAERAVRETQFLYNKGNRPQWARGAVGATLFTFKQYSISYLELLERMWNVGEEGSPERAAGRRAVLFAMGMLLLAGGAGGLPFMEDVEDVVDATAQRLGYNFSLQNKRRELLEGAFGKAFGGFLEKGVSGIPGAPIDVSGRLGLGNLIPATGVLMKKTDHTRDVVELLGPAGDLATRALNAADKVASGDMVEAGVEISPVAARNVAKAVEMASTGQYRDQRGYKVLDVDGLDAAAKAIGFQPGDVAKVQEADRAAQLMVANAKLREQEISMKWAKAMADRDLAGQQEARQMMLDWNEKNPDTPIKIRLGDVMKRARNMQLSRAERIEKSAPKEVRQEARRLLREQ